MQADVARLIANGQPLELFGDQLFLELDLSVENLATGEPAAGGIGNGGSQPMPHRFRKFRARFGPDAVGLVSDREFGTGIFAASTCASSHPVRRRSATRSR